MQMRLTCWQSIRITVRIASLLRNSATPHPGEAARLLGMKTSEIERDRLHATQILAKRYGDVVVPKGAGTIIASTAGDMAIVDVGNAGMASGGMGDVLSGIAGPFTRGSLRGLCRARCNGRCGCPATRNARHVSH